jgi:hypothetical protein
MFAFFTIASIDIIEAYKTFSEASLISASVLWFTANSLLAASFLVVKNKLYSFPVGLILSAILPFGWASPLNAAGLYFPDLGILGFLLFSVLLVALLYNRMILGLPLLIISIIANVIYTQPQFDANVIAIDTQQPPYSDDKSLSGRLQWQDKQIENLLLQKRACNGKGNTYLLPESSMGVAESWSMKKWLFLSTQLCDNDLLIANGEVEITDSKIFKFENTTFFFTKSGLAREMPARASVPGVNPARWHLSKNTESIVCFEGYLVWTNLLANIGSNRVLVQSNFWWEKSGSLSKIQMMTIDSYARLFGNNAYYATNKL